MRFLAFSDVAVFNHGGLVAVQSSDLPLRFLSTFSFSFHTPELSGAAGVYTADGCLAFTSHLRDRKNSAICDPQCCISGATQTEQGIDARAQPRFLTIPLNPHFPLPGPSKSAQCFIYPMEEGNKEPAQQSTPSVSWKSRPLSRTRGGTMGIRTCLWERTTNPNRLGGGNGPAVHGFADQIPLSWLWNHKIMRSKVQAWVFSPLFLLLTEVIFLPLPPSCGLRLPMFGVGLYLFPQTEDKTHGLALFKAVIQLPPCVLFNFDCGPYASHTNCHHQNCKSPKQLDFLETLS